jgi:2-dehydro-3-deoxygluconokinase
VKAVVTIGETMGLFTATTAGSRSEQFRRGIGGAESNVAIGLARLGQPSTWIGRLGSDGTADLILRELRAEGVRTHATVDTDAPTGLMVKTTPVAGRTRVDYHRAGSAGSRLSPTDIDQALVQGASLLHITGITPALSPSAAAAIAHAVELATDAAVPISFDVNHRASLWRDRAVAEVYRDLARSATIVFAGPDEASLFVAGRDPGHQARAIADLGASQVVIKLGADGFYALIDSVEHRGAAMPITPLDTVGAGDAFAAGYLAELLRGAPAPDRLATAVRAGAFACLGAGDWESLPHRAELSLLDSAEPVKR